MATHTVEQPTRPDLAEVAHAECDALWDVVALLEAAHRVTDPGDPVGEEEATRMRRLVSVAEERVRSVISAFDPYI